MVPAQMAQRARGASDPDPRRRCLTGWLLAMLMPAWVTLTNARANARIRKPKVEQAFSYLARARPMLRCAGSVSPGALRLVGRCSGDPHFLALSSDSHLPNLPAAAAGACSMNSVGCLVLVRSATGAKQVRKEPTYGRHAS